jgi:hypothetical protein
MKWFHKTGQLLLKHISRPPAEVLLEYLSSTENIDVPVFAFGKAVAM